MVLSASFDRTLKLWNIATGEEIRKFQGHTDRVGSVAFSPDGSMAISASNDDTIRLWDVDTGMEIIRMFSFENDEWVVMTKDGYYNCSDNGEQFLSIRIRNKVCSIGKYCLKYNRPDIVAKALSVLSV
jgi:WD40 repeat protein